MTNPINIMIESGFSNKIPRGSSDNSSQNFIWVENTDSALGVKKRGETVMLFPGSIGPSSPHMMTTSLSCVLSL